MIILDIATGAKQDIEAFEGDNTKEIKTIALIKDNNRVDLTGKKIDMGYVDTNSQTIGDIIENLTISNAKQGEISLPINSSITKKDGIYNCAFRITGAEGYKKTTAPFVLNIKANLFNKIGNAILDNNSFSKIQEILDKADSCLSKLETFNTTDIENKIDKATELNKSLTSNVASVDSKNKVLQDSIKQAEDFSKTLEGSTNFVQMRKDIDTLESNLKSKQSLAYSGSDITCNNSLEGRTTGLKLRGRTLQNLCSPDIQINEKLISTGNSINRFLFKTGDYTIKNTSQKRMAIDINNVDSNSWKRSMNFDKTTKITLEENEYISGIFGRIFDGWSKNEILEFKEQCVILEGDWTNKEMPNYFESIKNSSDKSKNLFNLEESKKISGSNITINGDNIIFNQSANRFTLKDSGFKVNTQYTLSFKKIDGLCNFSIWYSDGSTTSNGGATTYTTALNKTVTAIKSSTMDNSQSIVSNVQIEEGTQQTEFELYYKGEKVKYKSCGKNLFNPITLKNRLKDNWYEFKAEGNTRTDAYFCIFTEKGVYPNSICYGVNENKKEFTTAGKTKYYCCLGVNGDKKDDKEWVEITLKPNTKYTFSCNYYKEVNLVKYKDIQIEELTQTLFEPYKEDLKTILLPQGQEFNGLKNVQDTIEETEKGVEYTQNIGKVVLNGSEAWALSSVLNDDYDTFWLPILNIMPSGELLTDRFISYTQETFNKSGVFIYRNSNENGGAIGVTIAGFSNSIEDFKKWLQANPVTVCYELAAPIKTILPSIVETDVDTYEDTTHIMSLNSIPTTLDFSIPVNYGSVLNQHSQEINNIWNTINNLIVPALIDVNKNVAMAAIKNNL